MAIPANHIDCDGLHFALNFLTVVSVLVFNLKKSTGSVYVLPNYLNYFLLVVLLTKLDLLY